MARQDLRGQTGGSDQARHLNVTARVGIEDEQEPHGCIQRWRDCHYRPRHLLHAIAHVDGRVLWANLHPLFWLSLIPLAFVSPWLACVLYVRVAIMWLIPDRRIEKTLHQ
jgi:hypothetical protein